METIWAEVTCEVPREMVDLIAEYLVALSGNGVCVENLNMDAFSLDGLEDSPVKTVKSYFPNTGALEEKLASIQAYLAEHAPAFPGFIPKPVSVTPLQEEDWANNWKIHFKPSRVGKSIVIKPTWEDWAPGEGDMVIEIDPGMAFGTGTHPTSRLCLETLERIFLRDPPFTVSGPPHTAGFLDVGTGSGILAIAAAKFGANPVMAIDIDPRAVATAMENVALNHVENIVTVSNTPLHEAAGPFAVIVANILAEDLARMAGDLTAKMREGAFLVLSGILVEKEGIVLKGFSPFPLSLVETIRHGEWSCMTYRLEG